MDPAAISASPAVMTTRVESTAPESPAASATGTVSPSDIPMTMSRILSEAVKCFSTCCVCGMRFLSRRTGPASGLAKARDDVEVLKAPAIPVDVRLPVRRDDDRADLSDSREIGGAELLPELSLSGRGVNQRNPRGHVPLPHDVEMAAIGRPADGQLFRLDPGDGAGRSRFGRIECQFPIRARGGDPFPVGRDGVPDREDSLRGDRARLSAGE